MHEICWKLVHIAKIWWKTRIWGPFWPYSTTRPRIGEFDKKIYDLDHFFQLSKKLIFNMAYFMQGIHWKPVYIAKIWWTTRIWGPFWPYSTTRPRIGEFDKKFYDLDHFFQLSKKLIFNMAYFMQGIHWKPVYIAKILWKTRIWGSF